MVLTEHPTWNIIDSTKMKEFMTCPRRFFFKYVLGWKQQTDEYDLIFGDAVHVGMEQFMKHRIDATSSGYTTEVVEAAYAAFLQRFNERNTLSPDMVEEKNPKTPERVLDMFYRYAEDCKNDTFQTEHIEIYGRVEIGGGRKLSYKTDAITVDNHGYEVWDHKTSGWSRTFFEASFAFSIQIMTYLHVMYCYYGANTHRALINGLMFRRPVKYRKDGLPYANAGPGNEIVRIPMKKKIESLIDWQFMAAHYYDEIMNNMNTLAETSVGDACMKCFPKNETGCFTFNRLCPYHDFCAAWDNPVREAVEFQTPMGFVEEHWNPEESASETATRLDV